MKTKKPKPEMAVATVAADVNQPKPTEKPALVMPQFVSADFKNSWNPEISDEAYHGNRSIVGSSSLKLAGQSMRRFYSRHCEGNQKPPTEQMRLGTMIHEMVLEPEKFVKRFRVMPTFTGFTKDGKLSDRSGEAIAKREAWIKDLPVGAQVVTEDEYAMLMGIAESVQKNSDVVHVLKNSQREVVGHYRDPETGILLKIKPDIWNRSISALFDVKSCEDASYVDFLRAVENYGYNFQLAMYEQGIFEIEKVRPEVSGWIAIERTAPYECAVYIAEDDIMASGNHFYRKNLARLKQSIETGIWPGIQSRAQSMSHSSWYRRKMENEFEG